MRRMLMAIFGIIILITTATSFAGDCGDVNNSGTVNALDITYLINFFLQPRRFAELRNGDRH